jgi:hypothetical protein
LHTPERGATALCDAVLATPACGYARQTSALAPSPQWLSEVSASPVRKITR